MQSKISWVGAYFRICAIAGLVALGTAALAADDKPLGANVVASQGGAEVTLQDVDAAADKIPEGDRAGYFDSPKRIEGTVGGLLYQKQLAARARAENLEKDPLVQREIAQATDDVLARVQLDRYRKSLKLPDFEMLAKEYYASHKDEFMKPGDVVVEHILVSTKNRSEDEAKARIGEVEAAARAHPDQFDDLVEKYSDDPSKSNNHGRIAHAESGKMAKQFAAASNALKTPGEISPVVKTDFGFHVLKLIEKTPDRQRSFDEIHTDLLLTLRRNYLTTQLDQYSGEIRGKPLQANPDLVASLRTRYAAPGSTTMPAAQSESAKPTEGSAPAH
ncbi:MAG TPA: peptidylprolyl isomerase [Lacipirellulaceae bacterium]|nr:peptidylprolyl isomerase [Lacipirellulaceae bacterium]